MNSFELKTTSTSVQALIVLWVIRYRIIAVDRNLRDQ